VTECELIDSEQIESRDHGRIRARGFASLPASISRVRQKLFAALDVADSPGRIIPMEGVRGYAVLLVFLVHHHNLFGKYLPVSSPLHSVSQFGNIVGHSGVDIFFILSGFLIYGSLLRKPISYLSFCARRLHRIYPTFLFVFAIYVLLCHLIPSASKLPPGGSKEFVYLVENVLLLPGMMDIPALVTVAWSLSYEFFFYLTIPLIIIFTGMQGWRRSSRVCFFGCLVLIHFIGYRFGVLSHIRLTMFFAGVLLYEVANAGWQMKSQLSRRGEILIVGIYVATLFSLGWVRLSNLGVVNQSAVPEYSSVIWTGLLWVALFGLTLYCFIFDGVLKRLFSYTPLRRLGNMSYSYFLFHGLVLNGVAFGVGRLIDPETKSVWLFLGILAVNLLLTVLGSLILFLLIEKPFSLANQLNVGGARSRPLSSSVETDEIQTESQGIRDDKEQVCSE
jgi:exopolysaccharide production protein ExoZ